MCRANEPHAESVKKPASDGQKAAIMRALVPCAAYLLRWRVRSECNFIVLSGALAARGDHTRKSSRIHLEFPLSASH